MLVPFLEKVKPHPNPSPEERDLSPSPSEKGWMRRATPHYTGSLLWRKANYGWKCSSKE